MHWSLNTDYWTLVILCLIGGGIATIISFRIFQPYAFNGVGLDPRWVADLAQQRAQATGEADLPWNLQWARRSHLYSFTNLTVWGLGLPLGILAWAGFLYMGWRIIKGEWRHEAWNVGECFCSCRGSERIASEVRKPDQRTNPRQRAQRSPSGGIRSGRAREGRATSR